MEGRNPFLRPSQFRNAGTNNYSTDSTKISQPNKSEPIQRSKVSKYETLAKRTNEPFDMAESFQWLYREEQIIKSLFQTKELENITNLTKLSKCQEIIETLTAERNNFKIENEKLKMQTRDNDKAFQKYEEQLKTYEDLCSKVESDMKTYDERVIACENAEKEIDAFNQCHLSKFKALAEEFKKLELNSSEKFSVQRQQNSALMTQKKNLEQECFENKNQILNLTKINEDFQKQIDMLNATEAELKAKYFKDETIIAGLTQKNSEAQEENNSLHGALEELKTNWQSLTDEYNNFKSGCTNEINLKQEELLKLEDKFQSEIELQMIRIGELSTILETRDSEIVKMNAEIDASKESCQQVELLIAKEAEVKQEMEQLLTQIKYYRIKAIRSFKKYNKVKQTLDKELSERSKDNKHLLQQIENLHSDIEKEVEEKNKLSKQCHDLQKMTTSCEDCKNKEFQIIDVNFKLTEKVLEIEENNRKFNYFKNDLEEKDKQITTLNMKINEQAEQIEEINIKYFKEVQKLKTEFDEAKEKHLNEKNLTENKLASAEKTMTELQQQLNEKETEFNSLKTSFDKITKPSSKNNSAVKRNPRKSVAFKDYIDIIPSSDESTTTTSKPKEKSQTTHRTTHCLRSKVTTLVNTSESATPVSKERKRNSNDGYFFTKKIKPLEEKGIVNQSESKEKTNENLQRPNATGSDVKTSSKSSNRILPRRIFKSSIQDASDPTHKSGTCDYDIFEFSSH